MRGVRGLTHFLIDSVAEWQHSGFVEGVTHLYRGVPAVRTWSRYQHTIMDWTLCGIKQKNAARPVIATEEAGAVSCPFCLQLMRPSARMVPRNPILGRKQDSK